MLVTLPYVVLLCAFAVAPALYTLYLSFTTSDGGFTLIGNFVTVAQDFRYVPSLVHVSLFAVAFMIPALVIATVLALFMQSRRPSTATALQLIYYVPQGLVGAAGVVLWLFMLSPAVSPAGGLLKLLGFENIVQVVGGWNLVVVLALIAVWTSGTTILLLYAALKAIPDEVIEAALLDGANSVKIAVYVRIPMIRKWIAYVLILNFALSVQVFVEPQLVSGVASGVGSDWAPLQLAYAFAYQYVNFPAAAALSLEMLAIGIVAAFVVIRKTDLFRVDV